MATTSRRAILAGASAFAAASASTVVAASSTALANNGDAELRVLVNQYLQAFDEHERQNKEYARLNELYEGRAGDIPVPAELKWRLGDGLPGDVQTEDDGARYYSVSAINYFRSSPFMRTEFIGTDEEWQALPSDRPAPKSDLWTMVPDEGRRARADEIVRAYDRHKVELHAISDEIGLSAAEARADEGYKLVVDLEDRINALPARTVEGLQAKAQMIRKHLGDSMDGEVVDRAGEIAFQIARDIVGMRLAA